MSADLTERLPLVVDERQTSTIIRRYTAVLPDEDLTLDALRTALDNAADAGLANDASVRIEIGPVGWNLRVEHHEDVPA